MKITQIPMGAHNAQLTCYLQDPCTEMPALDRCPAILIFPGGAYAFCSDREADPVALAFLNAGYNAFVLRYSVSQNCPVEEVYTNAFAEAQEAMDYLHQNAGDLHIDPEQIAVVGFSAGGHLAASVGTMGRVRPAAMLLGYAVFSVPGKALGMELPDLLQQVDDQTPPAFLFATQGDHLVPATQSLQFATLLAERKIPYEMHIFAYGDHGFSTGSRHIANPQNPENPESAVWQGMALGFLNHIFNHDVLVPAPEEVKEFCLDMKIGTLLDTPQSAALIQQLLPELAQYVQQEPGSRGISVNNLQFYSNKMFDEDKLAALNEALAKLNSGNTTWNALNFLRGLDLHHRRPAGCGSSLTPTQKTKAMMTLPSCTICSLRNLTCVVSVPPISRSKPPKGVCRPTAWNAVTRRYAAC